VVERRTITKTKNSWFNPADSQSNDVAIGRSHLGHQHCNELLTACPNIAGQMEPDFKHDAQPHADWKTATTCMGSGARH
jgi:hypothetical protein